MVGAGAKPFIAYAILATTDYGVGDEVVYPNPGFPIYESQIKAHGAVPVPLHLREARNFAFDPAGTLWAVGGDNQLWRVNPVTGASTHVASITGTDAEVMGLMIHPKTGTFYATTYTTNSALYTLDPTTHSVKKRQMGVFEYKDGNVTPQAFYGIDGADFQMAGG